MMKKRTKKKVSYNLKTNPKNRRVLLERSNLTKEQKKPKKQHIKRIKIRQEIETTFVDQNLVEELLRGEMEKKKKEDINLKAKIVCAAILRQEERIDQKKKIKKKVEELIDLIKKVSMTNEE